jgi:hypothetical protein
MYSNLKNKAKIPVGSPTSPCLTYHDSGNSAIWFLPAIHNVGSSKSTVDQGVQKGLDKNWNSLYILLFKIYLLALDDRNAGATKIREEDS